MSKLIPKAIRNKKTGRLLSFEIEKYETWEYGGTESLRITNTYLRLYDSEFEGEIYVTTSLDSVEKLVKNKSIPFPDVRIDGALTDLEIVFLKEGIE